MREAIIILGRSGNGGKRGTATAAIFLLRPAAGLLQLMLRLGSSLRGVEHQYLVDIPNRLRLRWSWIELRRAAAEKEARGRAPFVTTVPWSLAKDRRSAVAYVASSPSSTSPATIPCWQAATAVAAAAMGCRRIHWERPFGLAHRDYRLTSRLGRFPLLFPIAMGPPSMHVAGIAAEPVALGAEDPPTR
jgi:hypothetical protein